jgi:chemotaxis methyl-accepting protein methylase
MHNDSPAPDDVLTAAERTAMAGIVALVRQRTGLDLCPYRPATILRRIRNRMISVGAATLADYFDVLQGDADETAPLVDRLTIKVSRFYRNRDMFDALRSDVLPSLAAMRAGGPVRIWCAGCGFGEEAYTLAMLLAAGEWPGAVDGTDIDAAALARASEGVYSSPAFEELPRDLADRYLVPVLSAPPAWRVTDDVRVRVRFSRHDLVAGEQSAHAGAYELVSCRNVLIYLQRAAQDQALGVLRRALVPGGVLCLGEAEWPSPTVAEGLEVVSRRARIFRAAGTSG